MLKAQLIRNIYINLRNLFLNRKYHSYNQQTGRKRRNLQLRIIQGTAERRPHQNPIPVNGMYGGATDANGLYYMRERYYNMAVERFIKQGIMDGSIENSQSLNKFSYMQGNPIRLTDPFGLRPNISLTRIGHATPDLLGIILGLNGCDRINVGSRIIENAGALIQSGS